MIHFLDQVDLQRPVVHHKLKWINVSPCLQRNTMVCLGKCSIWSINWYKNTGMVLKCMFKLLHWSDMQPLQAGLRYLLPTTEMNFNGSVFMLPPDRSSFREGSSIIKLLLISELENTKLSITVVFILRLCLFKEREGCSHSSSWISAIQQWLMLQATHTAVSLHHCILFLPGAPLDEGERASNLHDSHYDRELGTKAATLPASKISGRLWFESRQTICLLTHSVCPCCWVKTSQQSWQVFISTIFKDLVNQVSC